MAANTNILQTARIVALGGASHEATLYKGDGSTVYVQGQHVYIDNGVAKPVSASAAVLSTSTDAFAAAYTRGIVLEASAATSGYIKVQEYGRDTVFEAEVVDAVASDVTLDQTDIGELFTLYQDSTKKVGLNNLATAGIVRLEGTPDVLYPFVDDSIGKDSGGTYHSRVTFTFLDTLFS